MLSKGTERDQWYEIGSKQITCNASILFCYLTDTYIRLCQAFMLKHFAKTVNYFRKDFH